MDWKMKVAFAATALALLVAFFGVSGWVGYNHLGGRQLVQDVAGTMSATSTQAAPASHVCDCRCTAPTPVVKTVVVHRNTPVRRQPPRPLPRHNKPRRLARR